MNQAGFTSSQARLVHIIVFCNQRHAGISCSAHDPVASTDAGDLANSSSPRVSSSKCNDCVVMNVHRESTILDGILQTNTKKVTKLCPAHLLPDSIPPAPQSTLDEDNARPPTPLDENNAQPPTALKTTPNHQLLNPRWIEKPPNSFLVLYSARITNILAPKEVSRNSLGRP